MKKILSLILVAVMALTLMTPAVTASAESVNSYSVLQSEFQSDDSSGGFFQIVVDFFRSLFFSRITFDTNGGSEIDDYYMLKFSRISSPADPTKEGYTFIGWEPEIPAKMPWSNLTVKAKWQAKEHNVYWVIDGETVKTETYAYGDTITAYVPDAKEGYTFSGWFSIPESMPDDDVIISGTYTKDTEIVVTESNEEFLAKASELVTKTMNDENFDSEEALKDAYYACRVLAKCTDFSAVNISAFNADEIIVNNDGTMILQFSKRDEAQRCTEYLSSLSEFAFAEADAYIEIPIDTEIEELVSVSNSIWSEKYINADKYAYYLENNEKNDLVTVAVIDSGVDMDHPYLKNRLLPGGWDYCDSDNDPDDDSGHGTHVSGIIVNCTNNLNIKILPLKALKRVECDGEVIMLGNWLTVSSCIDHAAEMEVDVINLSIEAAHSDQSHYIEYSISKAIDKGVTVVIAAGNGSTDTAGVCPANIDEAIVVSAIDETGTRASFSNYGTSVDVSAPGVNIPSSYNSEEYRYVYMSGTSQAAPHIASVAAMFKLAYPDYTPAQIEALIKRYCVDKGPSGRDDFYGEGCPDMYNAIPDCTVSFDTNGGTAIRPATTKNSSSVTLPTPSKSYKVTFNANGGSLSTSSTYSNCSFDGWYTSSSFNGQKYSGGESYMLLDNQTMYAKWVNNSTNINGYIPTRNGYVFGGWYTAANGGTRFENSTKITDSITLYAHWNYWSDWSASYPSGQQKIESKTMYSYRTKSVTTSTASSLSGWTQDGVNNVSYGNWSGNKTTTSKPTTSDTLQIVGQYTTYNYYHYCNKYSGKWNVDSIAYGSNSKYHPYSTTNPLPSYKINADKGGREYEAYGYENCVNGHECRYGFWTWWIDNITTTYTYQTRDKITTYNYYKWSDWSVWSDTSVSANANREVKTTTYYRYLVVT